MELPALGIPVEYGGAGADHVTQAIMVEELARVCASTSLIVLISKLGMIPVMRWGSEELKREYLPRAAAGEIQCSYCLSEPDAGSDVASMKTRAVRDGDDYVISGTKYWITNAGISDTYTVFAKTDPDGGHRGMSCFLVEKDLPGISDRQARGQDRRAGEPDGRSHPRRGPGSGQPPHRRRGPRLLHRHGHARPQPSDHRRPGGRHLAGRGRLRGRLLEAAPAVRPAHRRIPGPPVHARRHGAQDRGGPHAGPQGVRARSTRTIRTASSR